MNSMIWRLFAGFWLVALLSMVLSGRLVQLWHEDPDFLPPEAFRVLQQDARQLHRSAQRTLRREGPAALRHYLQQLPAEPGWILAYPDGNTLQSTGMHQHPYLRRMVQKMAREGHGQRRFRRSLYIGRTLRLSDGTPHALLVVSLPAPRPQLDRALQHHRTWQLAFALLGTGLLCYVLARRSSRPLLSLSTAARRIADGDLSPRVDLQGGRDWQALAADFNHMVQSLEQAREAQHNLVRDVSHELRTPLARIDVALELARRKSGDSPELERISRELHILELMIDGIVQGAAKGTLDDYVELGALLGELVDSNRMEAEARSVELALNTPPEEALAQADAPALRSALENILRNAIRYAPTGSQIDIGLATESDGFLIEVRDRGPGVEPANLERLFAPFFREDAARSRQSGGYGLGLAIASGIIHRHRGRISARNARPGLAVEIWLPVPPADSNDSSDTE